MNKWFSRLLIVIIALTAYYLYVKTGTVINDPLPQITQEEPLTIMSEKGMDQIMPDDPEMEPTLPAETMKKIEDMVEKAKSPTLSAAQKTRLEEQVISMMNDNDKTKAFTSSSTSEMPDAPTKGTFNHIDALHGADGMALIFPETAQGPILRLQDLDATRGPDLRVYLSKNKVVSNSSQLGEFIDLGALKSSKGNQNYELPENYKDYLGSVVIWCRAFGVLFSSASLQ